MRQREIRRTIARILMVPATVRRPELPSHEHQTRSDTQKTLTPRELDTVERNTERAQRKVMWRHGLRPRW
jgi:hypothetical protein